MNDRRKMVLFIVISCAVGWLIWKGCDMVYQFGWMDGEYRSELGIGQELRQCRSELNDQEFIAQACDRALFECEDGARYTER